VPRKVASRTTETHQKEAQIKREVAPRKKNEKLEHEKEIARPKNISVAEEEQKKGQGEGDTR